MKYNNHLFYQSVSSFIYSLFPQWLIPNKFLSIYWNWLVSAWHRKINLARLALHKSRTRFPWLIANRSNFASWNNSLFFSNWCLSNFANSLLNCARNAVLNKALSSLDPPEAIIAYQQTWPRFPGAPFWAPGGFLVSFGSLLAHSFLRALVEKAEPQALH